MPQLAFAAIAAAAGTAISAGVAGGLASITFSALATSALGGALTTGLGMLTTSKPKSSGPRSSVRQATPIYLPEVYGECRVGGAYNIYTSAQDNGGEYDKTDLVTGYVIAPHRIEAVDEIWNGEDLLWTLEGGIEEDYEDRMVLEVMTGRINQLAPQDLLNAVPDDVDENFRLRGMAWVYIRYKRISERWKEGVPSNLWFKVRGKRVFDLRNGEMRYTANWALCFRDFLLSRGGVESWMFDEAQIAAAANVCDEDIGGRARYEINGSFPISPQASVRDYIPDILRQGGNPDGFVDAGGVIKLYPGAYTPPVDTFGDDDFASPLQIYGRTHVEEKWEGVNARFPSRNEGFNVKDTKPHYLDSYTGAEENARVHTLSLPFETRGKRAQRLALLALRLSQRFRGVRFSLPLDSRSMGLEVENRIALSSDAVGISGVFKISRIESNYSPDAPSVDVEAIEDGPSFWSWSEGDATEPQPSIKSKFPSASKISAPTGVVATPQNRVEGDGSTTRWVDVSWDASSDAYIDMYEVLWKQGGEPRSARTGLTSYRINNLSPVGAISVEVAAINTLGITSAFASAQPVSSSGDATPPATPSSVSILPLERGFRFRATKPSDADLAGFRLYEASKNGSFGHSVAVMDVAATAGSGSADFTRLGFSSAVERTYYITAYDRSGNESGPSASLTGKTISPVTQDEVAAVEASIASGSVQAINNLVLTGSGSQIANVQQLSAITNANQSFYGVKVVSDGGAAELKLVSFENGSTALIRAENIILDGSIQNAQIQNLAVDTIKVKDNSIAKAEKSGRGVRVPGNNQYRTYISDTITLPYPGTLLIIAQMNFSTQSPTYETRILVNGQDSNFSYMFSDGKSVTTSDSVYVSTPSGVYNVEVQFKCPPSIEAKSGNLSILGIMK